MKLSSFENKVISYFKRAKPASIYGLKVIYGKHWDLDPEDVDTDAMAVLLVGLYCRMGSLNENLSHKLNAARLLTDNHPHKVQAPNYFGLVRDNNEYWENLIAVMASHFKLLTREDLAAVEFVLTNEFDKFPKIIGTYTECE